MIEILIKTIPHSQQRYPTVGDYVFNAERDTVIFYISKLGDWRYEACVAIHELTEFFIIKMQGVKLEDIDKFDIAFEKRRKAGNTDEPGDDPKAPYRGAHCVATGVERILAALLGVCWKKYEAKINSL